MSKYFIIIISLFMLSVFIFGCSSNPRNPVMSEQTLSGLSQLGIDDDFINPEHALWGVGTIHFDLENMTATIEPARTNEAHFNVTSFLPFPMIQINSYNPTTQVIDVDVSIYNKFPITAYDVRLIIYTDNIGHRMMNADDWTDLYDKPGGYPINPFKAYYTNSSNRAFGPQMTNKQNLQILLPGGNPNVTYAIDASYPGNCEEPYSILKFTQLQPLYDYQDCVARAEVELYDWQNNVSEAYLYCPSLFNNALLRFFPYVGNIWGINLENRTGEIAGNYAGVVIAKSSNSGSLALYDFVTIVVTHFP